LFIISLSGALTLFLSQPYDHEGHPHF
jgi:hypothetical protein